MGLRRSWEAVKDAIGDVCTFRRDAIPKETGRLHRGLGNVSLDGYGPAPHYGPSTGITEEREDDIEIAYPELGPGDAYRITRNSETTGETDDILAIDAKQRAFNERLIKEFFDEQERQRKSGEQ